MTLARIRNSFASCVATRSRPFSNPLCISSTKRSGSEAAKKGALGGWSERRGREKGCVKKGVLSGAKDSTLTFFPQTFRAPPEYPRQNPGISRQKVCFPWVSRDMPNLVAPTPSCGRSPDPKVSVCAPASCRTYRSCQTSSIRRVFAAARLSFKKSSQNPA